MERVRDESLGAETPTSRKEVQRSAIYTPSKRIMIDCPSQEEPASEVALSSETSGRRVMQVQDGDVDE